MSALFSKFQVRYGHKWTSALPTPELIRLGTSEWAKELSGVTVEQVKNGLDNWDNEWPPSCVEFRKVCTGANSELHNTGAYKLFERLPKPKTDPQVASKHLAAMKKATR